MELGKLTLALVERKVGELDDELVRLTGLAAHEIHVALAYPCLAGTVAAALLPLLAEPIGRHALAEAIAEHGVHEVRAQLHDLYDRLLADPPKEKKSGQAKA